MTTLEIVSLVVAVIGSLIPFALTNAGGRLRAAIATRLSLAIKKGGGRSPSVRPEYLADAWRSAAVLKAAQAYMGEEISAEEREIITRLVWRSSEVPLVRVLRIPQERDYLLHGLANPSKYPWPSRDTEDPGNTGSVSE